MTFGTTTVTKPRTAVHDLLAAASELMSREPSVFAVLGLGVGDLAGTSQLMAAILAGATGGGHAAVAVREVVSRVLAENPAVVSAALADVSLTTARNFEPGGAITTLLTGRGVQALLGHRVAHALWVEGRRDLSLAMKTVFGRAFCTDIHPAARFGPGIWLDHGLGFVVGETAVVEEGASIWHGVTLGSTLKSAGEARHPRVRRGCTIGADAVLLGGIEVGAGSVVAAGSVVLVDVPPGTTVAGVPALPRSRDAASFAGFERAAS